MSILQCFLFGALLAQEGRELSGFDSRDQQVERLPVSLDAPDRAGADGDRSADDAHPKPAGNAPPKKTRAQEEQEKRPDPAEMLKTTGDWELEIMPDRVLYRPYLADPRQAHSGIKLQFPIDSDDDMKFETALGGYRALALWTDPRNPNVEMQLALEAALFSRFDISEGNDIDATDYRFGFPFLYRDGDVTIKVHLWHLTSHMGDEFMEREDRKRESYHINELSAGFSLPPTPHWRVYGEIGIAVYTGPATESGRVQAGVEWIGDPITGKVAPFAAIDFQTRNEIGWSWNGSVQAGLMVLREEKANGPRVHVEFYRGHDQQTQFKSQLQHYWSIGVAADF